MLEAEGSSVSAADIKSLLSGPDIGIVAEKLANISATRWSIPEARFEPADTRRAMAAVFHDIVLEDIVKGRVGRAHARGAESEAHLATGRKVATRIGAWTAKGFDIAALAQVVLGDSSGSTREHKTVYGHFTIENYKSNAADGSRFRIGRMTASDFQMRPLTTSFLDHFRELSSIAQTELPTTPEQQAKYAEAVQKSVDLIRAYAIGEIDTRDISIFEIKPEPTTISIDRIGVKNFADAQIGEMTVEGTHIRKNGFGAGNYSVGRFMMKTLDLAEVLNAFRMNTTAASSTANSAPNSAAQTIVPDFRMPHFDEIAIEDFYIDAMIRNGPAGSSSLRPLKLSLGKWALAVRKWSSTMPVSYTGAIENFVTEIDVPSQGLTPELAASLSTIELSLNTDVDYDEAARRLTIHNFSADLPKYAQIKIKSTIEDVHPEVFSPNSEASQRAMAFAAVKSLDVELTDRGAIAIGLAEQSARTGMRAEQLREQMAAMPIATLPQLLGQSQETMNLARAISAFAKNGGTLKIAANSLTGVGMSDLANIPAIMDKVDIKSSVVPPSGNP